MTYEEERRSQGWKEETHVDWIDFFKKETYTSTEITLAEDAACSWVTCACGNQDAGIPRDRGGRPKDEDLRHLGGEFANSIGDMRRAFYSPSLLSIAQFNKAKEDAQALLGFIQARAIEILSEINKTH